MDIVSSIKHSLVALGAAPVMWLLLALSVASVAVTLERALHLRAIRADLPSLIRELGELLAREDYAGARALLGASRAVEAQVVGAGLAEISRGSAAVREAMAGAVLLQRARLERRIGFLGTLASNAPFVGLFGTVIGVILAFDELGASGHAQSSASAVVMASIAEALVATAVGIGVAVPAVVAFNAFQQRIRSIVDQSAALGHVLLVHVAGREPADDRDGRRADHAVGRAALALARQTAAREEA